MSSDCRWSHWIAIGALLLLEGCADFRRGEYWNDEVTGGMDTGGTGTAGTGTAMLSFADDVYPRLVRGCQRCHSPEGSAGTTSFLVTDDVEMTHASTVELVDTNAPGDSRLLSKARGEAHQGGEIFAEESEDHQVILTWIEQGAQP